jgi:FdhD protein
MATLPGGVRAYERIRQSPHGRVSEVDAVAQEEPLEIRIAGRSVAVLLRTPGHDEDLATGFALTEGILGSAQDVERVAPCISTPATAIGNVVDVILRCGVVADFSRHLSARFSNSACGVCGTAVLGNLVDVKDALSTDLKVQGAALAAAPKELLRMQPAFRATGGLHAVGLLGADGSLRGVREDVGRHNAADKALGAWALEFEDAQAAVLVVSSRAGFEIVAKAYQRRVPVVVSVGAPTSLAIDAAKKAGITLVAFASASGISIYTHENRVR